MEEAAEGTEETAEGTEGMAERTEGAAKETEDTREEVEELGESVAAIEAKTDCFELSVAGPAGALVATPAPAYSLVQ